MKNVLAGAAGFALLISVMPVSAEIIVSGNDGKQMRPGDTVTAPEPDSISVLSVKDGKVKLLGSVAAPAGMIGPPAAVAVTRDSRLAIVTACQSLQGDTLVPADTVSLFDLSVPSNPRVIQTVHAGPGASGVSISPNGKLVLVASTGDDSVTAFTLKGRALTQVGKVQLEKRSSPTDVVFTPNGKTAIAVGRGNSKLMLMSVNGNTVTATGKDYAPGRSPYGAVVTKDGKYAINTNLGGALDAAAPAGRPGGMSRQGTVSMTDLATGNIAASVVVGPTPEHVVLSADGKYIGVVVANGTASVRSDPKFNSVLGLLEIYAVGNGTLTPVTRSDTGHWCQGAVFSRDNRTVLLQCAAERQIEIYHFDGKTLTRDAAATVAVGARPGSIASAWSR